ncbi:MAG: ABC transporter substrate-binding protein [Chitinophagales bacterium]|nr:ABC transporter substrate-binding protein [Chitinophagaceae bacterium]MCB9064968.1 ABC transporter substrate-binding protein [Chitinophagales bacterium]
MLAAPNSAQAQFWKKWFKKKETVGQQHNTGNPDIKTSNDNSGKPIKPIVRNTGRFPETTYKDRYSIDVLAPLYLDELIVDGKMVHKTSIPQKVMPAILFYEGITLAADTLKKLGYRLDIHLYDVANELESPLTLINTDQLANSDLMIGILSSKDFQPVAKYAKRKNINFISALSPSDDGILDNPYFTMLQPTLQTHCQALKEHMSRKYKNIPRVMLYRTNVEVDNMAFEYFSEDKYSTYIKYNCNNIPNQEDLQPLFDNNSVNIILMPIISDDYSSQLLTKLYEWFPNMQFEVWGMPSWNDMAALKKATTFPNVAVYYTSPYYFDASTASGQELAKKYKARYGSANPDKLVYRGYETMMWYAYLLKKYGSVFNEHTKDTGMAPFTRYDIRLVQDRDDNILYNENHHLYLYRFQSGSYIVSQ